MDNKTAITKFSTRLKDLRKEKFLSQSEVAQKLGIPPSTYANWEQGRREPSIADIYNIIEHMNIDANDLFDID
ncbi:MAG: helix-turn-helix domain-containing protein [Clostridia bacterium]|nr:helix-turn-helix domain-containing protein [Clostridia bacterium]